MDTIDGKILNKLQFDFPLDLQPYLRIAEAVGTSEADVLARIGTLRREKVIREISAIFDTRNLGYASSLVAMRVAEDRLFEAASRINLFPGVSHNYRREARFNLWLTVAVPPGRDLEETVKILAHEAGAEATLLLPVVRLFKIGVKLDVTGGTNGLEEETPPTFQEAGRPLSQEERGLVSALQEDLSLTSRPFTPIASRVGLTEDSLLEKVRQFLSEGIMRRYAAVLRHRKAGFSYNGMGIWRVPPERSEEVGTKMASFQGVSHCYQRPAYPEWPYTLYTMVHGTTKEACEKILRGLSEATGMGDYEVLYSTEEYKKERIRYFSPAFDDWYRGHAV